MFPRELIDPPLNRFSHAKIVATESQNRFRLNRPKQPIRQRHRHADHAPLAGAAHDLPGLDQAEALGYLNAAGGQVGGDARARKTFKRIAQPPIAIARAIPPRRQQQIMGGQLQGPADRFTQVQRRHQLRGAEDQDVFVKDRRAAFDRGRYGDLDPIMLIGQDPAVRSRGQGEDRMLHRAQITLRHGIENIT